MGQADVLIVGAGHGGAQAATALRQNGFEGSILLVGREPEPPYERPPLSKEYLAREKTFERFLIRPAQFWTDKNINLKTKTEVVMVDAWAKVATLTDGTKVSYGSLIWAAGGDPRRLTCAGSELAGIHAIRTRADVDALAAELEDGAKQSVVIGGGYIGLEAAAALTKLGCSVVLLEALPRVLARVAGAELSAFYETEHRAHGVDLRTNIAIDRLLGEKGRVTGVRLQDGTIIPADIVIVGIGIAPCVDALIKAGAEGENGGVRVDEYCRTTLGNVYAIGDCASHTNQFSDAAAIRLESVQNANDMATVAAKSICGDATPYVATPWFWSNQFDLRLQTVGLSAGHDQTVLRGDPSSRSFSVVYLRHGRIVALDCVNMAKDYIQGKKLVEARALVDPQRLADTSMPLKDLL